jgi:hypothetical protein
MASVMAIELQEELLARERGLDDQEVTLLAQEDGLVSSEHTLGLARMACDAERDRAETVQ